TDPAKSSGAQSPRRAVASKRTAEANGTPQQTPRGTVNAAPAATRTSGLGPRNDAPAIGSNSIDATETIPPIRRAQPMAGRSAAEERRREGRDEYEPGESVGRFEEERACIGNRPNVVRRRGLEAGRADRFIGDRTERRHLLQKRQVNWRVRPGLQCVVHGVCL